MHSSSTQISRVADPVDDPSKSSFSPIVEHQRTCTRSILPSCLPEPLGQPRPSAGISLVGQILSPRSISPTMVERRCQPVRAATMNPDRIHAGMLRPRPWLDCSPGPGLAHLPVAATAGAWTQGSLVLQGNQRHLQPSTSPFPKTFPLRFSDRMPVDPLVLPWSPESGVKHQH